MGRHDRRAPDITRAITKKAVGGQKHESRPAATFATTLLINPGHEGESVTHARHEARTYERGLQPSLPS